MNNNNRNEGSERSGSMKYKVGNKFTSPEMYLEYPEGENEFYQGVIEFYGLDSRGPSYTGRVFLNNPNADENAPLNESSGYVGSYYIFGNDGCWGDIGHCDPKIQRNYDSREHYHVELQYQFVDATEALRKCVKSKTKFTVTVVPLIKVGQAMSDTKDVVRCQRIRATCYENPAELKKSA